MKRALLFLATAFLTTPALAEWRVDGASAIISPASNNGTAELLSVSCDMVEVFARGGRVAPESGIETDYVDQPGMARATVDGTVFPLIARAESGGVTIWLDDAGQPVALPPAFMQALKAGTTLTLAFDATPDAGADGSAFETVAAFPLAGSGAALDAVLAACPVQ